MISHFFNTSFVLNNTDKLYDNKILYNTIFDIYTQNFKKSIMVLNKIKEWHKTNKYENTIKKFVNTYTDNYSMRYTFFLFLLENGLDCYIEESKRTSIINSLNNDIVSSICNGYRHIDCDEKMNMYRVYEVFKEKGLLDESIKKDILPY